MFEETFAMKKQILAFVLILVMVAAALPGVMAHNQVPAGPNAFPWLTECEEDLTGETLTFYHFGDLSARYAPITTPLVAGFTDAIEYMNTNGGICGAQLAQEFEDTANEVERAQAAWDKYSVRDDAYSVFIYNSNDGELLRDLANEAEIVLFNAAGSEKALYGESSDEPGYQFSIIPLYTDQMGAFCTWIADPANRETVGLEGDPVIGYLSWPDAFGRSADTPATRAFCESVGVGFAENSQLFLPDTADLSPLIVNLTEQGANIIYTNTLATGPANIAKTLSAMGIRDQILLAGPNWVLDSSVIGLGGEDSFGIVGNLPYLWWDELTNPGVQIITGIWVQKYLSQATDQDSQRRALGLRNIAYLSGFSSLDLWAEAMIRTINRVGYENMSGAALYETLVELEYEAFQGLLVVDFTDGKRASDVGRIGSIQLVERPDGSGPGILPLSDWVPLPDLRANGADVPAGG
jgi:ABC-type branched-subunit amino acid transport system substrate-binding protein